ncbi:hypothetical protein TRFO_36735 [Tritrichomonas foetus]|uniref:Protein regulator of cytokinesis 1 n=1 Tax=Tritrichomonas foetus TaxID=1144522 RepID=A0A1J4JD93_9EUKA|nr:hypothetical protein TRFO_36735 [Tritrichomonas foetus]|eukprot:OHS97122.1 hypothetical protein TRFO_36735 [Tritrichomonas foetus]
MKIEINIESQLEDLWHKIGLEGDEIEMQYQELNRRIQDLCKTFLQENFDRVEELTEQAEKIEEEVRIHMKKFCIEENGDIDQTIPLLYRIQDAQNKLEMLKEDTHEQEEAFLSAFHQVKKCFEILEMDEDEQGEFAEAGIDFSLDRIDRMNKLLTDLETEIEYRQPKMEELVDEINELYECLGLGQFQQPDTLGNPTFVHLEDERDGLAEQLEHNREEAKELLRSIHSIEKILKCKPTPKNTFEICSETLINKLKERLSQLETEKDKRIPEFIEATKKQLLYLWGELHIPIPSSSDFPFIHNSPSTKRTLIALESEVRRIENLKAHIEPMLDLIAIREDILNQYNRQSNATNDSTRLMSRRGGAGTSLIEEERIRKRYQVELPKIHAKLIPQLEEYQETFGEPFLWDGEDLLEEVTEMHRKEAAAMMQTKARNIRKKTSAVETSNAGRTTSRKRNLVNRAPFQLQEFMF